FLGHDGRAGVHRFLGVPRENQAGSAGKTPAPQHIHEAPDVNLANDVIASAVEEETKVWAEVILLENIRDQESGGNTGRRRALLREVDGPRADVHTNDIETLLRQPDRVRSRAAAEFQGPAR